MSETKSAALSTINQAACIMGLIAIANLVTRYNATGSIELSPEDSGNVIILLSSIFVIMRRTFFEVKQLHFFKK